jgi:hypothetical protein
MLQNEELELDQTVRLHVYGHFLTEEEPPTLRQIASALEVSSDLIAQALERLARARSLVLRPGTTEILMAMPLSADPTPFEVSAGGHTWWANCAWDALGVPAMLNCDARISAPCADCGEPLAVRVVNGEVQGQGELIHFTVPAAHWWDDITYT